MNRRRPKPPPRPWRRVVLIVLLLLGAAAGFVLWRLANDRERITAFLVERAEREFALTLALDEPAQVGLWPRPGVRLTGVRATVTGGGAVVVTIDELTASVPWRALWSDVLTLGSVSIEGARVDRDALDAWLAALGETEQGPPRPLRWPRTEGVLEVACLDWVEQGEVRFGGIDARLSPVAVGEPFALDASWSADEARRQLTLRGVPRNDGRGIAVDQMTLTVHGGNGDGRVNASGDAEFASAAVWEVDLDVAAARWPAWLIEPPPGVAPAAAIDVSARVRRMPARWRVVAKGKLGGADVDADLALPPSALAGGFDREAVQRIAASLDGRARIDRVEIDGLVLEDVRIESGAALEAAETTPEPAAPPAGG